MTDRLVDGEAADDVLVAKVVSLHVVDALYVAVTGPAPSVTVVMGGHEVATGPDETLELLQDDDDGSADGRGGVVSRQVVVGPDAEPAPEPGGPVAALALVSG